MVSHNPAEIAKSGRVVVLSDGQVIEDGTPADLIKKKGYFSGLYQEEIDLFQSKNKDCEKKQEETIPKRTEKKDGSLFYSKYVRGQVGK